VVHSSSAYDNSDDPRLWELAARQHGVVSWEQLWALGHGRRAVHRLVAKGWLHRVHRAVYAVGHKRLSVKGQWMAAVLACGPGAALSHAHAAALHDLRTTPSGLIDVTAPGRRHVTGVRAHRARTLDPHDVTVVDGIPVTTVARTLLDQAEHLSPQRLRTLLEATLRRDLFDLAQISATIARNPGRHGIAPLTEALTYLADEAPWTQSEKERHFLEFARAHGLPEPRVNVVVLHDPVDFFWPASNLIVEVDGWEFHKTHEAFEADRLKDAKHHVAGYLVLRITARRIERDAPAVAAEIRVLLRRGSALAAASGR
jgi:very-short-patch-repair endonuclease